MSEITLLDRIKSILAEVTVTDITEIELASDLEIDLGIDMETDFPRVVSRIIKEFELPRDARELLEEVTTVGELVGIIREETELG